MHCGAQSNFVAADIEDGEFPDLICVGEGFPQLRKIRETFFPHDRVPTRERRPCVRMLLRELVQPLSDNDVHSLHSINAVARSRTACSTTLFVGPATHLEASDAMSRFTSRGVT
jgi:hypothetical protein